MAQQPSRCRNSNAWLYLPVLRSHKQGRVFKGRFLESRPLALNDC